jgi:mono/diheme cytochrome c family protein
MRKQVIIFLYILLLSSGFTVHGENSQSEFLYMQTCYVCHGDDGEGLMPGVPDLADNEALFKDDEAIIAKRIQLGMDSKDNIGMPPNGGNPDLNKKQLLELVKYVKQLVKP